MGVIMRLNCILSGCFSKWVVAQLADVHLVFFYITRKHQWLHQICLSVVTRVWHKRMEWSGSNIIGFFCAFMLFASESLNFCGYAISLEFCGLIFVFRNLIYAALKRQRWISFDFLALQRQPMHVDFNSIHQILIIQKWIMFSSP